MRRKVWVAVFGLLVLAVVAQSMVLVERRPRMQPFEVRVGPNGQVVKLRNSNQWQFATNAESYGSSESDAPMAQAEVQKARASLKKKEGLWSASVKSDRLPLPAAEEDAMAKAINTIVHELQLSRVPSREFVRTYMIANRSDVPGPEVAAGVETVTVNYDLKLTPDTWQLIVEDERQTRIRNRMGALGAFVAVLTVLFGCVAGYIRIDDATKGYYSGRLKVAIAVVLALATIGVAALVD